MTITLSFVATRFDLSEQSPNSGRGTESQAGSRWWMIPRWKSVISSPSRSDRSITSQRVELLTNLIRRDVDSPWMRLAVQSSLQRGAGEVFATLAADGEFRSDDGRHLPERPGRTDFASKRIRMQTERALRAIVPLADSDPLFTLAIASQLIDPSGQTINVASR